MSLETGKLTALVEAKDITGIQRWVDDVVSFARNEECREILGVAEKEAATFWEFINGMGSWEKATDRAKRECVDRVVALIVRLREQ